MIEGIGEWNESKYNDIYVFMYEGVMEIFVIIYN